MERKLFEWDPEKEKINKKKHGISFDTATKVFNDYNGMVYYDHQHSTQNEDRYKIIGLIDNSPVVIVVIYTKRELLYRIISARRATKAEEKRYYASKERN